MIVHLHLFNKLKTYFSCTFPTFFFSCQCKTVLFPAQEKVWSVHFQFSGGVGVKERRGAGGGNLKVL